MKDLIDTICYVDVGKRLVVGKCRAKDIKPKKKVDLDIDWIDC